MADDPLIEVNQATLAVRAAMEERDDAIRRAHAAGYSFMDIAQFALLSKGRIGQIIKEGPPPAEVKELSKQEVATLRALRALLANAREAA